MIDCLKLVIFLKPNDITYSPYEQGGEGEWVLLQSPTGDQLVIVITLTDVCLEKFIWCGKHIKIE